MVCRSEHLLLFYASVSGYDNFIVSRVQEILRNGVDWRYLVTWGGTLGVACGLRDCLARAGIGDHENSELLQALSKTEHAHDLVMKRVYRKLSALLNTHGFDFIPLKGCDPRISEGARKNANSMADIDILVRKSDVEDVGDLLEKSGYRYHGIFNGSHVTFFADGYQPESIEIHWDLINPMSFVQERLFRPSIDAVWERSARSGYERLLSYEDLLAYLTVHAVKEYFHKPKWLHDIGWLVKNCSHMTDVAVSRRVFREWGVSRALGIVATALTRLFDDGEYGRMWDCGAVRPGISGWFLARRLVCYDRLRSLRPLLLVSCAETNRQALSLVSGMGRLVWFRVKSAM